MSTELRKHQRDALDVLRAAVEDGAESRVVVLPTGAGKTIIRTPAPERRSAFDIYIEEYEE